MRTSTQGGRVAIAIALLTGTALVAGGSAAARPAGAAKSASLVIRHQTRGCHAWSLNGGRFVVKQTVRLARGGFLTLTNNDLMAQELIRKSGSAVKQQLLGPRGKSQVMMGGDEMGKPGPYALTHSGAKLKVTFPKAGTYRFAVMDRGDYVEVKTVGEDNELTLTVIVG